MYTKEFNNNLTKEFYSNLTKEVLIKYYWKEIECNWNFLPTYFQKDSDIQQYKRCLVHYNQSNSSDQFDGPAPLKINCVACKNNE